MKVRLLLFQNIAKQDRTRAKISKNVKKIGNFFTIFEKDTLMSAGIDHLKGL